MRGMGAETVRVKATHGKQKTCSHVTVGSSGGLTEGVMGCGCFLLSILISIYTLTLLRQRDSL